LKVDPVLLGLGLQIEFKVDPVLLGLGLQIEFKVDPILLGFGLQIEFKVDRRKKALSEPGRGRRRGWGGEA
jgi:hypothetical protein